MEKQNIFVGMKHGKLTVLRQLERVKGHGRYECLCECGNTSVLRSSHFYESRRYCSRSCPLLKQGLDLTGKTFGRWTVTGFFGIDNKRGKTRSLWKAKCICGTEKVINGSSVLAGQTQSCGCLLRDMKRAGRTEAELLEARRLVSRLSNRKHAARVKACKIKYETKRESATPKWVTDSDMLAMNDIYKEARRLTRETGIRHQVDHIIPINGEKVSGLHVPQNLQILTQAENVSKSNRYAELLGD